MYEATKKTMNKDREKHRRAQEVQLLRVTGGAGGAESLPRPNSIRHVPPQSNRRRGPRNVKDPFLVNLSGHATKKRICVEKENILEKKKTPNRESRFFP